jgi:phosphotransferase system enzyme I (PtsP)
MSVVGSSPESGLLLTLEEISQLVSHSHHPGETLTNIVRLIQGRFHTDVCSVYVLEPERNELVLGATIGLKAESVGQVRMHLDEGLTGLVAERLAPVMVDDAFAHPRFKFFPEAGEDPYHSFLGIPLIEGGALQGVLVIQTREPRVFSPNEVRMLVTVGAQLASLVSEARLIEQVVAVAHEPSPEAPRTTEPPGPVPLQGVPLSPGVGSGQVYLVNGFGQCQEPVQRHSADPAGERQRLAAAMAAARDEITRLGQRISALVGEDHGAILQGQLMILQDSTIELDLTGCLAAGSSAEGALLHTLNKYVEAFQKLTNPVFQERVYDIKDVFRRILWHLRPGPAAAEVQRERLVLVAHEASVMDLFSVDLDCLVAVAVEKGGKQSHAAILARSLGIPMVGQVPDLVQRVRSGRRLRVDGSTGRMVLDPPDEGTTAQDLCLCPTAEVQPLATEALDADLPQLQANINLLCEIPPAVRAGAHGVGLFRSEFLFLARRTLPTEEEQVRVYRKLLQLLEGRPASIRTFDLRPDKMVHYTHLTSSLAHPLDWRLVLESPPLQKLFKDQVRAILRAATVGPARILVPLIAHSEQLDFVQNTLDQAREELEREGLEFARSVPLGIMIEVAGAVPMAGAWAAQVDYFALGTNDLLSSALGIDRQGPIGGGQDDQLHPGFLRLLHQLIDAAHQAGRRVTVCGEMAGDPRGALALLALEVDALSVAVPHLGCVRQCLLEYAAADLSDLGAELLQRRSVAEVKALLTHPAALLPAL